MKIPRAVLTPSLALCLKNWVGIAIFLTILLAIPMAAAAQAPSATIIGTVPDSNGASIPAASITARNTETGLTRTVTSDSEGNYRIEFLPVGNYTVEVSATSGFKKALRDSIVLRVSDI